VQRNTLTIYIVVVFEKFLEHIIPVVLKENINGGERVKEQHVGLAAAVQPARYLKLKKSKWYLT